MTTVEIFSQGEEVVSGHTVDTNAAWLSQQLISMGFSVTRHTAVGDKLQDLMTLLTEIAQRSDVCICSGGLGPTIDDLTAQAVAQAFDMPLQFDEQAYQQICAYYQRKNKPMPASNRKQALLPVNSLRLDNEWGTAPGFAFQYQRCWFAFVPGVPIEMRHMFADRIQPLLKQNYVLQASRLVSIKSIGIGESDIQQQLQDLSLPDSVQLSFCAGVEDVQTKLQFEAHCSEHEVQSLSQQTMQKIGDFVYAVDGLDNDAASLAQVVADLLQQKQLSLAAIETISHGQLLAKCREYHCLDEVLYAATQAQLIKRLGLPHLQETQQQTAERLAKALHQQTGCDLILVQLFDHDQSLLADKQQSIEVLTVLFTPHTVLHKSFRISGHLLRKQNQAAILALDFVRRFLQHKTL